jgi:hypothetical protein
MWPWLLSTLYHYRQFSKEKFHLLALYCNQEMLKVCVLKSQPQKGCPIWMVWNRLALIYETNCHYVTHTPEPMRLEALAHSEFLSPLKLMLSSSSVFQARVNNRVCGFFFTGFFLDQHVPTFSELTFSGWKPLQWFPREITLLEKSPSPQSGLMGGGGQFVTCVFKPGSTSQQLLVSCKVVPFLVTRCFFPVLTHPSSSYMNKLHLCVDKFNSDGWATRVKQPDLRLRKSAFQFIPVKIVCSSNCFLNWVWYFFTSLT